MTQWLLHYVLNLQFFYINLNNGILLCYVMQTFFSAHRYR